jgi:hypothetical protein
MSREKSGFAFIASFIWRPEFTLASRSATASSRMRLPTSERQRPRAFNSGMPAWYSVERFWATRKGR